MVFQLNPFPKSIFENALMAKNSWSSKNKTELEEIVHTSLKAAIFDEVKDRLDETGTSLSGGQQQGFV